MTSANTSTADVLTGPACDRIRGQWTRKKGFQQVELQPAHPARSLCRVDGTYYGVEVKKDLSPSFPCLSRAADYGVPTPVTVESGLDGLQEQGKWEVEGKGREVGKGRKSNKKKEKKRKREEKKRNRDKRAAADRPRRTLPTDQVNPLVEREPE